LEKFASDFSRDFTFFCFSPIFQKGIVNKCGELKRRPFEMEKRTLTKSYAVFQTFAKRFKCEQDKESADCSTGVYS
jgi:hypothetical protein